MEAEVRVPTAGGQLLEFCLKSIGQHEQLDTNTMLALLSLVNLTNILELIAQGSGQKALMLPSPQADGAAQKAAELIPPGSDKAALLNNLMGMLGSGDLSKLMPLVSMLGNALKSDQQTAERPEPPKEVEGPAVDAAEQKEEKEPRPVSGWARVGR